MFIDPDIMDLDHIKNVQKVLNDKLGSNLSITGKFDSLTTIALTRFQHQMNLSESGIYDKDTQEMIEPFIQGVSMSDATGDLTISQDQFQQMVGTDAVTAAKWYQPTIAAMVECGIITPLDACAFLAQIGHETNGLRYLAENLNYSAQGLANTWPKRYQQADKSPNATALRLARNPEAIANNVYANRLGNGDEASGDGWRHRGQGPIQLTGKANQQAMGVELNVDLVNQPELLQQPVVGARASARFWLDHGISAYANRNDFDGVSDQVNIGHKTEKEGDAVGYADRKARFEKNKTILGV